MTLGARAQRARDGHALLLPARQLAGELVGLLGDAHAGQVGMATSSAGPCSCRVTAWGQRAGFQNGQVREQVELLEHHAHFGTHGVHVLAAVRSGQCHRRPCTVSSRLMQRISVDFA